MSSSGPSLAGLKLTPRERECLIERAAIMEFDGGMTRDEAEAGAKRDLLSLRHKEILSAIERWPKGA